MINSYKNTDDKTIKMNKLINDTEKKTVLMNNNDEQ